MGMLALSSAGPMAGCGGESPQETERVVPELTLQDLRFRVYRDARLAARGKADRATYRRDTSDFRAERIQVDLEQSRGGKVTVTAPAGRGNARSRDLFAFGGVRLEQGDTTAATEEARFFPAEGLVRGDRPISVRSPDYTLAGPSFTLDPRTEKLEVHGGTRLVAGDRGSR